MKFERGHVLFIEALQKWTEKHGDSWLLGAYVVNGQISKGSQFNCGDKYSLYNFYFGRKGMNKKSFVFSEVAQQHTSKCGVLAANTFSVNRQ